MQCVNCKCCAYFGCLNNPYARSSLSLGALLDSSGTKKIIEKYEDGFLVERTVEEK